MLHMRCVGRGATLSKCIPRVKLPKYTYTLIHFNTPGIFFGKILNEIVTLLQLHWEVAQWLAPRICSANRKVGSSNLTVGTDDPLG